MSVPPTTTDPPAVHTTRSQLRSLGVVSIALGALALYTMREFVPVIIVAAWVDGLVGPTARKLSRGTPTRWAGAAAVAAIISAVLVPVAVLAVPLARAIRMALSAVLQGSAGTMLQRVLGATQAPSTAPSPQAGVSQLSALLHEKLPSAVAFVTHSFGSVAGAVVQFLVLLTCAYVFTLHGPAIIAVLRQRAPLAPEHFDRIGDEFLAVGRTLLFSQLLIALAKGVLAAILYQLLGIGNALFFASLTAVASLFPIGGSALVWVPLSVALAVQKHYRVAVILFLFGVLVIGTLDNVLHPVLARVGGGRSTQPLVLFLGILGGVAVFGPWGLVLGPLILALCTTAWELYGEAIGAT
jgi:predicted PurR-regulated permease PerM